MCEEAGNYPAAIGQKVMSCTKAADLFFHEMDTSLQAFSLSSWHERDVDNCDLYDDEGLSTADFLALLQNTKADTDFVDWQANCYCNSNIFKSLLDSSTRKVCHIYIQDSIKAMAVGAACRCPLSTHLTLRSVHSGARNQLRSEAYDPLPGEVRAPNQQLHRHDQRLYQGFRCPVS